MRVKMLGKLKKVDVRKAWKHEAADFTTWLSQEENLSLLSEEIGIELELIQTEASVGRYYVDILAKEQNTGRKIIIENQLKPTDHAHLGQVITYASGFDAKIIVWIVREVHDEHKRAIDWLNDHTDEETNFFLIKMELWQIGDSPFAPKFQIISKPNEWAKAVKESAGKATLTETKVMQLDFWNKFKEYVQSTPTKLRLRKTSPQRWYDISFGSSEAHISLTVNTRENLLGCEIYLPDSKELFEKFFKNKDPIEKELDEKLKWMGLPGKKARTIKAVREGGISDSDKWEEYFGWFKDEAEKFQKVFYKYANMS